MTAWVLRLMIANVIVFGLQMLRPVITQTFAFVPILILEQPWTLLTYMFLHGDMTHILFNMLGLFFFGPRLEAQLGSRSFLTLYLISGFFGALLSFLSPGVAIIGASGAVFGVMFAFAYFWPSDKIYVWGVFPVEARTMVIVMTVLSLVGGCGGSMDGIAHFAHLGGFLGGFLYLKWLKQVVRATQIASNIHSSVRGAADLERWKDIPRENLHEVNRAELDRILDKINTSGVGSISPKEREFLERFSKNG